MANGKSPTFQRSLPSPDKKCILYMWAGLLHRRGIGQSLYNIHKTMPSHGHSVGLLQSITVGPPIYVCYFLIGGSTGTLYHGTSAVPFKLQNFPSQKCKRLVGFSRCQMIQCQYTTATTSSKINPIASFLIVLSMVVFLELSCSR